MLVMLAWLTNQAIGYFILNYPRSWDSFAWGAAIGVAAGLATFIAGESQRLTGATLIGAVGAFLSAFIVYEGTLFAATSILPSSDAAFSLPVVLRIFEINAVAYVGLLVLHRLATAFGLLAPSHPITISHHA